ncbi:MAG: type 4a pilus biogenesis protein PilO [Armatimonadota bacterium]
MKIPKIQPITMTASILGFLVICLAIMVTVQQISNAGITSKIDMQEQVLSKLIKESTSASEIEKSYARLSARFGGDNGEVTWDKQMPRMINALTGAMQAHGLKIETLKPEPITVTGSIQRFPLRITFKSKLRNLVESVREIEKLNPYMDVEGLNIRVTEKESNILQADAIVSLFAIANSNSAINSSGSVRNADSSNTTDANIAADYSKSDRGSL